MSSLGRSSVALCLTAAVGSIVLAQDQAFARIEREVIPIIARVGEEQGFTLLFNKFESGLVCAPAQIDITDSTLQLYDESVSGDG